MGFPARVPSGARRFLVADEDPTVVAFVIEMLRKDGHVALHAHDAMSAAELALSLTRCDLVISNTRVNGIPGSI